MRRLLAAAGAGAFLLATPVQVRKVLPQGPGPQRLEADLALLARASKNLHDLRLVDAAGHEVPYVVVAPATQAPEWKTGRILPLPTTKASSGFELDLGSVLPVERLRVEGLPRPILKRYRLEASGDRQRWTELVGDGTLFDLPEERLQRLECEFPAGPFRYFRLQWDDRTSARVALPRAASVLRSRVGSAATLVEPVPFAARSSEPGASRYVLRLPGRGLPMGALRLELGGSGPLLRAAEVDEPRLESGRLVPRTLGRAELRRAERGGLAASIFRIPMEAPEGAELELVLQNGANPAVELKSVVAEAGPQPWVYFESSDGAPLEARYGDPKLPPPRYDLEARRESLASADTRRARWGGLASALPLPAETTLDPGPGGAADPKAFRFLRPIPEAPAGLAALLLDAHVLASSPALLDLRILDGQGRQVPYLLERRDEPQESSLRLPQPAREAQASVYPVSLPAAPLPQASLVLEADGRAFRRDVRVEELLPGGEARTLARSVWEQADGEPPVTLALPLGRPQSRVLRIVVEEGDNQPLRLKAARLLLPAWRLRFFHPGSPLRLGYGAELGAPQYDLALLADRLRSVPVRELAMDGAPAGDAGPAATQARLFWTALVAAIAVLLLLLARLLKRQPGEEAP